MKKLIRTSLTFGFVAALPVSALAQQPIELAIAQSARGQATSIQPIADPALEAQIAAADEAFRNGDYRGSLRQYGAIAEVQRENGMNAAATYWRIAEIQNALGSPLRTAQALDNAAREAERFGDANLQVRALYEAAVSYAAGNQVNRSTQRMRRVQGMLDNPGVSEEVQELIRARMGIR